MRRRRLGVALMAVLACMGAPRQVFSADQAPAAPPSPPAAPAAPAATGTVSGEILDKTTGDPIIEAGVEVVGQNKKMRTDLDGHFKFELPAGSYEIRISAPLH